MGRPINKKYFGNRNVGGLTTSDDYGVGGQGLASFTTPVQKGVVNITDTYKYFPTLTVATPTLPGATAIATPVWEINTVTLGSAGTGYTINLTGASVTSLSGSIWTAASITPTLTINTNGTGNVSAIAVNATLRGEWTTIDGTGIATWAIEGAGGGNAQVTVTFRLKRIDVSDQGSGYTTAPTGMTWARASSQTAGSQTAVGTVSAVLTTNSGSVGSTTYEESAIKAYAWVASQREIVDIVKQSGSRRYTVKGADGTVYRAKLTAADSAADGEMDLTATDVNSNTYYVTKLTERRAKLTRKVGGSNYVYADDESAPWSFDAASGIYVQIDNA